MKFHGSSELVEGGDFFDIWGKMTNFVLTKT